MKERKINTRRLKGEQIAYMEGAVRRVSEGLYHVLSQNGNGKYDVRETESGWICSCPDHVFRNVKCKHLYACEYSRALRQQVESCIVIQPVNTQACPSCMSEQIVKHGLRRNKYGVIQRYVCKNCKRWFVFNLGFERMKASPQTITSAMQLYFTGESLRNVQKFLGLQGVQVSHVAVYKWIRKYVSLMEKYLDQIRPKVSDTWRADELYVKIRGNMKYLFAVLDDQTRYWIAQEVASAKDTHDVRNLFKASKLLTGKKPKTLITDGLAAYHDAYGYEFYAHKRESYTEHIRGITIHGDRNNNKMERFNGEIRDRERVMRGLKREDTPILKGYEIFHNYLRPHEALEGKTPAEACGIKVKGENKWLTLIQNASKQDRAKLAHTSEK